MQVIDRIVSAWGDVSTSPLPWLTPGFQDGSRVNAIVPPLALWTRPLHVDSAGSVPARWPRRLWWRLRSISSEMLQLLAAAVKARVEHPDLRRYRGGQRPASSTSFRAFIPEGETAGHH